MKKRILLVIAIMGFALGSCDKEMDDFVDNNESTINLIAPNGQKIAANVEILTNIIAEVVEEKYCENKDVNIDDVIYYDTDYGFIS